MSFSFNANRNVPFLTANVSMQLQSTIFLPIFFDRDIPVLTPDTMFSREENLTTPVIASAALY